MFDKVSDPYIEIFDSKTGKYLGRTVFRVTPEVENAILGYIKNEGRPRRVVLQDVYFYPVSPEFITPPPFQKHSYQGILNVMLRDQFSSLWTPMEIQARFNIMERMRPLNNQYYFPSVEFSDIQIKRVTQGRDQSIPPLG